MSNLYVVRTKEFTRNYDREMYVRNKEDIVIMADFVEQDDIDYTLFTGTKDERQFVASFPRENVLLIANKANLATD